MNEQRRFGANNIRVRNLPVKPVGQAGHVPTRFHAKQSQLPMNLVYKMNLYLALSVTSISPVEPPIYSDGNSFSSSRRHTPKAAKPYRENGLPRIIQAGRPPELPAWAPGMGLGLPL